MSNPIVDDISYIDAYLANAQTTYSALCANAQRGLNLKGALQSNAQLAYNRLLVDTFIAGYADWYQASDKGYISYSITDPAYPYYGNNQVFYGNLNNFYVLSAPFKGSGASVKILNRSTSLTNSTYTISAGPLYYALASRITLTAPTTSINTAQLVYNMQQYAFINQYIWANPNDKLQTTELPAIPATPFYNIKSGINSNSQSLMRAATSMQGDLSVFQNKQTFLSTIV